MNTIPRYMQVMNYYIPLIKSGKLKEGDKMPTEEEICRLFQISRITVRKALDGLMQSGYIYKQQGKGSYVTTKKTGLQLDHLKGFSEEMRMLGKEPTSKILSFDIVQPSEKAAGELQMDADQKVYLLERLRSADGEPISIERVYLPFHRFPTLQSDELTGSLYEVLQLRYGCVSHHARQQILAGVANEEEASILGIGAGAAVLRTYRTTCEQDQTAFEYVEATYRGDQYQFNVTLYKEQ